MRHFKLVAMIFAFSAVTAFVGASESDDIREQAKAMGREAAQLAEQGHKEEATNLKRKAVMMLEEAERLQHGRLDKRHPERLKLKQWLEKLRQEEKLLVETAGTSDRLADVRREAEVIEDKLRHMSGDSNHEQGGPREDIVRRLEHMRIAVKHLNQAGLHDLAEHAAERAEAAERDLHEHRQGQGGDVMLKIMNQLDELRHEVGRLRDEVNELSQKR
jgi:methyl-accepting chemotaxis protein